MFSTERFARLKTFGSTAAISLLLVTGCGRDQLSLPVAQAASTAASFPSEPLRAPVPTLLPVTTRPASQPVPDPLVAPRRVTANLYQPALNQSCYAFMLRRPAAQRATAVQARLKQADEMSEQLDSETFNVELVGDHANILSLEFPQPQVVVPAYSKRVSAVLINYLSAPTVQDDLCNTGFSEVHLSARGPAEGEQHLLWTARVTSEGLMKLTHEGRHEHLEELVAP